jgi:hypothetical protein
LGVSAAHCALGIIILSQFQPQFIAAFQALASGGHPLTAGCVVGAFIGGLMGSQISLTVSLFRRWQELRAGNARAPSLQLLGAKFRIPSLYYAGFLAALIAAVFAALPKSAVGLERTLPESYGFRHVTSGEFVPAFFTTDDRTVRFDYSYSPDTMTFVTRSRLAVSIDVDVNQNGTVDQAVDVSFKVDSNKKACKSYMYTMNSSTGCNIFASASNVQVSHDGNVNVLRWTIPISELTTSSESVSFQIATLDTSTRRSSTYPGPTFLSVYHIALKRQPFERDAR